MMAIIATKTPTAKCSSKNTTHRPGQDGFGAVLLLAFIPVLLALIFVVPLALSTQQTLLGVRQICRTDLLDFQEKNANQLTSLLALNNKIRILRLEKKLAQVELATAVATENAPAAAQAEQKIIAIDEKLATIDFTQKRIIATNALLSQTLRSTLPVKIRSRIQDFQQRLRQFVNISAELPKVDIKALAVRPEQTGTIAPIYELEEPFLEQQSSQAFWKIRIATDSQGWLHHWLPTNIVWKDACGASLRKERQQWQQVLIKTDPNTSPTANTKPNVARF